MALVTVLLLAVSGARAQDVRLGLRSGATFGFFNDSAVPFISDKGGMEARTNVRLDFHAGVHAIIPVSGPYALQPELLYVQKGSHLSRHGPGLYISERYRVSYIQAHFLGRRTIPLPGPLTLHGVLGPTVDWATGGEVKQDVRSHDYVRHDDIPLLEYDLIQRWNVGVVFGIGVKYPVGSSGAVSLDLRYNRGFRTVFTDETRPASERQPFVADPPPLRESPPPLRHDVIMASLTFTIAPFGQ